MCRPLFLQNGKASSIYKAIDQSCDLVSREGLQHISITCPHSCLCEVPDAASANKRNKQKRFNQLGPTQYAVDNDCADHQLHRIVQSTEKQVIGDLHAMHVTCTNTSNQNRLQKALWELIDEELDYRVGSPDDSWAQRNELIAEYTVLRHSRHVADGMSEPSEGTLDSLRTFLILLER